jgi:hypothetical protein
LKLINCDVTGELGGLQLRHVLLANTGVGVTRPIASATARIW